MSERDASLLFGVFAVQFKKITPQQLHEVAAQWQQDPTRELSRMLVESGHLTEEDYNHIRRLVDDAHAAHAGDSAAALQTFGGQRMIDETYRDAITLSQDEIRTVPMPEGAIPGVPIDNIDAVDETPGRYTNQSEYARGGIGRVLLVHDQHLGREIAMKELLPFTSYVDESMKLEKSPVRQSMALVTRFLQEARVTGQLEHPSIVPVYELGRRRDGTLYYTMKLVRGRTLASAIRETETLPNRLLLLSHFVDLCQAIAYSHSRRVIHRDIKPSNVMVGKFGETVVLDWGLAKVKDRTDDSASQLEETLKTLRLPAAKGHETHAGQVLGTPAYMPPEQAAGQIERIDERSDVYSLGAVLYTLLTGKYPYDGDNASEILNRLLVGPPKPVLEVEPTAPPELAAICDRAMQREADKRYKNAKDLAEDVIRFQTGALVLAHSYKFRDHLTRFVQHHKPALATAALFTVALAVFAVYSYVRVTHERNNAIVARNDAIAARDSETEQRKVAEDLLYQSNIRLAQSQIDAKRFDLAKAALDDSPKEFRGWEWDYLTGLGHQDIYTFETDERGLAGLAVSSDGSVLVTGGGSGAAYVLDATNGKLLKKLEGDANISAVAINPAVTRVLTVSVNEAAIWDMATGTRLFNLTGNTAPLAEYGEFSPDGRYAVTGSKDGTVRLWNTDDGVLSRTFAMDGEVMAVAQCMDGSKIAAGTTNGTVKVWDAASQEELLTSNIDQLVYAIKFSPDGNSIVVGCIDGSLYVWKTFQKPSTPTALAGHVDAITSIEFTSDGKQFITASTDGTVRVWQSQELAPIHVLHHHAGAVKSLASDPLGRGVVSVSADSKATLFDPATGNSIREWAGHSGGIIACKFVPGGKEFVTISIDGTLKAWQTAPGDRQALISLRGHNTSVVQVSFDTQGKSILTRSARFMESGSSHLESCVRVWDVESGRLRANFQKPAPMQGAVWSPDGAKVATAAGDTVTIWDLASGKELRELIGHTARVMSVKFSPDGAKILTTSKDKTAILWRAEDGQQLAVLAGNAEEVYGGEFSGDAIHVATFGKKRELRIWDTATGKTLQILEGHEIQINAVHFLRDHVRMISAAGDGRIILWDTNTGREIRRLDDNAASIWDMAVSPDEEYLAAASADANVRIYEIETGKILHVCAGHSGAVLGVSYSPDGKRLASCGDDATVRLWDPVTGRELVAFREHTGEVNDIAFSPDGATLASGSLDSSAILRSNLKLK